MSKILKELEIFLDSIDQYAVSVIKEKILQLSKKDEQKPIFRPMLFSTPMVQAMLKGKKTQTRRIVDLNDHTLDYMGFVVGSKGENGDIAFGRKQHNQIIEKIEPKASIGDIIWVRETFNTNYNNTGYIYKADYKEPAKNKQFWKSPLFMPKNACRLFLKISNIRIEKLDDISEEDAVAEGVEYSPEFGYKLYCKKPFFSKHLSASDSYMSLWESINGQDSWKENPFVFVYDFGVIEFPNGFC